MWYTNGNVFADHSIVRRHSDGWYNGDSVDPNKNKVNTPRNATSAPIDFDASVSSNPQCMPTELDTHLSQVTKDVHCALAKRNEAVVHSVKAAIEAPSSSVRSSEAIEARRRAVLAKIAADQALKVAEASHLNATDAAAHVAAMRRRVESEAAQLRPAKQVAHEQEMRAARNVDDALAACDRTTEDADDDDTMGSCATTKSVDHRIAKRQDVVNVAKSALDEAKQRRAEVESREKELRKAHVEMKMRTHQHSELVKQKSTELASARQIAKDAGAVVRSMYGTPSDVRERGAADLQARAARKNIDGNPSVTPTRTYNSRRRVYKDDDRVYEYRHQNERNDGDNEDYSALASKSYADMMGVQFDSSWYTFEDAESRTCSYYRDDDLIVCPMTSSDTCPTEFSRGCMALKPLNIEAVATRIAKAW
jgi:hypothetical protein